jgi:hypothetical protein
MKYRGSDVNGIGQFPEMPHCNCYKIVTMRIFGVCSGAFYHVLSRRSTASVKGLAGTVQPYRYVYERDCP